MTFGITLGTLKDHSGLLILTLTIGLTGLEMVGDPLEDAEGKCFRTKTQEHRTLGTTAPRVNEGPNYKGSLGGTLKGWKIFRDVK